MLLFPDQHLTDPEPRAFAKLVLLGTSNIGKSLLDGYPEFHVIFNIVESGVPRGHVGDGESIRCPDVFC